MDKFIKVVAAVMIAIGVVFAQTEYITVNGIELVLVKAGNFKTSGGTTVTLTEDFYIGKYPVTQAQYRVVMGNNPSKFSGDNKPVENVTLQNVVDFCKKVGGFLLTEAQWEFAARGGNNSKGYIYSGSNNLDEVGWYGSNSGNQTHDVGQKKPNELGIYDMSGNVWNWCSDWYQDAYPSSSINPTGACSGTYRVLRGGSWDRTEDWCRFSCRGISTPGGTSNFTGFRVAFLRNSVTFNTNGGSVIADMSVPKGGKIIKPADPTRAGYTFGGWWTAASGGSQWDFANNTVTANVTLYARWTIVTYDINYSLDGGTNHTSNPKTYNVTTSTITLQPATREHYTFGGWFTTTAFTGTAVTSIPVGSTGNKTFYAKLIPIPYTVTFNSDGGTPTPPTQTVNSGNFVPEPTDPTRTGYMFADWFTDTDHENAWSFTNNMVTKNINLKAKWSMDDILSFPQKVYIYDGAEKKLETLSLKRFVEGDTVILREGEDFNAEYQDNIKSGEMTASVTITGKGDYEYLNETFSQTDRTSNYSIQKRLISVTWQNTTLTWNGEPQSPTMVIADKDKNFSALAVMEQRENVGSFYANVTSLDANVVFTYNPNTLCEIVHKEIEVKCENTGPFVYNKMVQAPTAKIKTGDVKYDNIALSVSNRYSQVGVYVEDGAPIAQIIDQDIAKNIILTNRTVSYEIKKKPLDVALKDDEIKRTTVKTVGDLEKELEKLIGYNGFAVDSDGNADNESVLSGKPKFEVSQSGSSQRSLRGEGLSITELIENGEYLVKVSVSDIIAQNYMLKEEQITVKVSDSLVSFSIDNRGGGTPTIKPQKSDKKQGIMLEKNVVSDKAQIHVILPNDKVSQVKVVIYDNTGNVVFERSEKKDKFSWNLTNSAGRNVANGTYLAVAEVKGGSGKTYVYSAKLGIKR